MNTAISRMRRALIKDVVIDIADFLSKAASYDLSWDVIDRAVDDEITQQALLTVLFKEPFTKEQLKEAHALVQKLYYFMETPVSTETDDIKSSI